MTGVQTCALPICRAEVLAEVQGRLSKEYGVRVETLVLDVRSREDVESKVPAAIARVYPATDSGKRH